MTRGKLLYNTGISAWCSMMNWKVGRVGGGGCVCVCVYIYIYIYIIMTISPCIAETAYCKAVTSNLKQEKH